MELALAGDVGERGRRVVAGARTEVLEARRGKLKVYGRS